MLRAQSLAEEKEMQAICEDIARKHVRPSPPLARPRGLGVFSLWSPSPICSSPLPSCPPAPCPHQATVPLAAFLFPEPSNYAGLPCPAVGRRCC